MVALQVGLICRFGFGSHPKLALCKFFQNFAVVVRQLLC